MYWNVCVYVYIYMHIYMYICIYIYIYTCVCVCREREINRKMYTYIHISNRVLLTFLLLSKPSAWNRSWSSSSVRFVYIYLCIGWTRIFVSFYAISIYYFGLILTDLAVFLLLVCAGQTRGVAAEACHPSDVYMYTYVYVYYYSLPCQCMVYVYKHIFRVNPR